MSRQKTIFGTWEAKCRICGRKLTDPQSVKKGIGPVCEGKGSTKEMDSHEEYEHHIFIEDDLEDGIIFRRAQDGNQDTTGRVITNVKWLVKKHSPTGMDFGYGGSGPSDAALNTIENILHRVGFSGDETTMHLYGIEQRCFVLSVLLYQSFKSKFITTLPQSIGGVINFHEALCWIMERAGMHIYCFREVWLRLLPNGPLLMPFEGCWRVGFGFLNPLYFRTKESAEQWCEDSNFRPLSIEEYKKDAT